MSGLPHLRLENSEETLRYTYAGGGGGGPFRLPPRDPDKHTAKLRKDLTESATTAAQKRREEASKRPEVLERKPEGFVLTFESDPGHDLKLESLERRQHGIELVGVREVGEVTQGKVFVPDGELIRFLRLLDQYAVPKTGNRRNKPLIDSIASVRLAVVEDFWEDTLAFPKPDEKIWWEVWLRGHRDNANEIHSRFRELAQPLGIPVTEQHVAFPEHVVLLAHASAQQLSESLDLLTMVAELRKAKELATPYVELEPRTQREFVNEVLSRLVPPPQKCPSVCILDSGVNRGHPLLAPALAEIDVQTVDASWGAADHDAQQHGTGMAGIALYGCLTHVFNGNSPIQLRHRLESVKILPPPPGFNEPQVYGWVTQEAAARAQIQAPERNRVLCMAVTADDRDMGLPSAWSGAVDELCAGVLDETPKLMFIAAGNVRGELYEPSYRYHGWNCTRAGIEDPAQAWNALTVGAYTDKAFIQDPEFEGWQPLAQPGDLCPTSRTSLPWPDNNQDGWPIKPDLVMEGGNYAERGGERTALDDLSLLTTRLDPTGRLIDVTRDTSPATAAAARLSALLWSHYPRLRPETIRALLVHSARWTQAMTDRFPGERKSVVHQCLRCYGYGVPDLSRALYSAENVATLLFEGSLRPYRREKSEVKTNEMHLHTLPWPREVLEGLGATPIRMRVTLSYFIEPSPGRVGWGRNHRYQSHGLRFDVIRPLEDLETFKQRISRAEWEQPHKRPTAVGETRNWVVGKDGRTHGSIHCDWWEGTAAELARCDSIVVYPVTGWWRERPHLGMFDKAARYSLVVTIETPDTGVDLYHAITAVSEVATEVFV